MLAKFTVPARTGSWRLTFETQSGSNIGRIGGVRQVRSGQAVAYLIPGYRDYIPTYSIKTLLTSLANKNVSIKFRCGLDPYTLFSSVAVRVGLQCFSRITFLDLKRWV